MTQHNVTGLWVEHPVAHQWVTCCSIGVTGLTALRRATCNTPEVTSNAGRGYM